MTAIYFLTILVLLWVVGIFGAFTPRRWVEQDGIVGAITWVFCVICLVLAVVITYRLVV